jgi:hypothetical protein
MKRYILAPIGPRMISWEEAAPNACQGPSWQPDINSLTIPANMYKVLVNKAERNRGK